MTEPDPFNLKRFVAAQEPLIGRVRAELRAGRKTSHWMWFVFPQIAGLGFSTMAELYAIGSRAEAVAYIGHSILGPRLVECASLMNAHRGVSALNILGRPDDLKFRSSMTLFAAVAPAERTFTDALAIFFGGDPDPETLKRLD